MSDINALLDYFITVHDAGGEGFSEEDINAHLRDFCEILQDRINHPFSDGGPEPDYDKPSWRGWVSEHGAHVAFHSLSIEDKDYKFSVRTTNLTDHGYVIDWFSHARDYEVGLHFMFYGAIVDLNNEESMETCFRNMRNILIQTESVKPVLEHLKDQDVWTYLIPNIVY